MINIKITRHEYNQYTIHLMTLSLKEHKKERDFQKNYEGKSLIFNTPKFNPRSPSLKTY